MRRIAGWIMILENRTKIKIYGGANISVDVIQRKDSYITIENVGRYEITWETN